MANPLSQRSQSRRTRSGEQWKHKEAPCGTGGRETADGPPQRDPGPSDATASPAEASDRMQRGGKRTLTVFERMGSPTRLPKADEIPDGLMGSVVREMHRRFNGSGIHLSTLSPNVSPRELYEFMTGEFLRVEISAHDTPVIHCFVYEAFRHDPWTENERRALDHGIRILLRKEDRLHMFPNSRPITVNGHRDLTEPGFRRLMQGFRSSHSDIVCLHAEATRTTVREDACVVKGRHVTGLCNDTSCHIARGGWSVEFHRDGDVWLIRSVRIEGIDF